MSSTAIDSSTETNEMFSGLLLNVLGRRDVCLVISRCCRSDAENWINLCNLPSPMHPSLAVEATTIDTCVERTHQLSPPSRRRSELEVMAAFRTGEEDVWWEARRVTTTDGREVSMITCGRADVKKKGPGSTALEADGVMSDSKHNSLQEQSN
jgi:hypothetical protein